jgi:hypothetical protein
MADAQMKVKLNSSPRTAMTRADAYCALRCTSVPCARPKTLHGSVTITARGFSLASTTTSDRPAQNDSPPRDPQVYVVHETDRRFRIAESTIPGAGKGLFAEVALAEGDELEVVGVLVLAESDSDHCSYYADEYKIRVGQYLMIPLGYGAVVNHSSEPNMEKVIDGHRVCLRALRPIDPGEELFWRYSDYAQERFGFH